MLQERGCLFVVKDVERTTNFLSLKVVVPGLCGGILTLCRTQRHGPWIGSRQGTPEADSGALQKGRDSHRFRSQGQYGWSPFCVHYY